LVKIINMINNIICPRCLNGVPNNDEIGRYPGALSRTDNLTEICSRCGEIEALEDWQFGSPLPQEDWLVQVK